MNHQLLALATIAGLFLPALTATQICQASNASELPYLVMDNTLKGDDEALSTDKKPKRNRKTSHASPDIERPPIGTALNPIQFLLEHQPSFFSEKLILDIKKDLQLYINQSEPIKRFF